MRATSTQRYQHQTANELDVMWPSYTTKTTRCTKKQCPDLFAIFSTTLKSFGVNFNNCSYHSHWHTTTERQSLTVAVLLTFSICHPQWFHSLKKRLHRKTRTPLLERRMS